MAAPVVTVYRNGDSTYPGRKLVVNRRQIRTMGALLDKVTRDTRMKNAARSIKTPTGGHTIKQLDSLESGGCYVAVGPERFKPLPYTEIKDLQSKHSPRKEVEITPVKHSKLQMSARARKVADAQSHSHKTIHVFRNGDDLYPSVKMLLDKRELSSMDILLKLVTSKVRLQSGAVFWLFTLDGKEIKDPSELENGEQYVAVGHGKKFKRVAYSDDTMLSPRSRMPTKQQLKASHARSNRPSKPKNATSKGHKRKSSSSTSNSQASSHTEEHHSPRKPTAEIQDLIQEKIQEEFIAQPPAERSPTPTNKESVYKASGVAKEDAKEVQDDREIREDKPIDQMAAEEVEEEEIEDEQENEAKNNQNDSAKNNVSKDDAVKNYENKKDDETKKDESRPNSGFGGFLEDLIDDVREKFDDDDDDDVKKDNKKDEDVKKDETDNTADKENDQSTGEET